MSDDGEDAGADERLRAVVSSALPGTDPDTVAIVAACAGLLATVAHADRIAVLESGRITEIGAHQSLMASDGHYRDMVLLQTSQVLAP